MSFAPCPSPPPPLPSPVLVPTPLPSPPAFPARRRLASRTLSHDALRDASTGKPPRVLADAPKAPSRPLRRTRSQLPSRCRSPPPSPAVRSPPPPVPPIPAFVLGTLGKASTSANVPQTGALTCMQFLAVHHHGHSQL